MFQFNIPKVYWSYAVLHIMFLINRIPTKVMNVRSLHEVFYGEEPDMNMIKTFGWSVGTVII